MIKIEIKISGQGQDDFYSFATNSGRWYASQLMIIQGKYEKNRIFGNGCMGLLLSLAACGEGGG